MIDDTVDLMAGEIITLRVRERHRSFRDARRKKDRDRRGSPARSSGTEDEDLLGDDLPFEAPHSQKTRLDKIAVHLRDILDPYPLGTCFLALTVIRASSESLFVHPCRHARDTLVSLGLALRKEA
jgi:hypothetical protein